MQRTSLKVHGKNEYYENTMHQLQKGFCTKINLSFIICSLRVRYGAGALTPWFTLQMPRVTWRVRHGCNRESRSESLPSEWQEPIY